MHICSFCFLGANHIDSRQSAAQPQLSLFLKNSDPPLGLFNVHASSLAYSSLCTIKTWIFFRPNAQYAFMFSPQLNCLWIFLPAHLHQLKMVI